MTDMNENSSRLAYVVSWLNSRSASGLIDHSGSDGGVPFDLCKTIFTTALYVSHVDWGLHGISLSSFRHNTRDIRKFA